MGETPKSLSIGASKSSRITLKEFILDYGFGGLKEITLRDAGNCLTRKGEHGVFEEQSQHKGRQYVVLGMESFTPWDPNCRAAALHIRYKNGTEEWTYLHERFADVVVKR